MDDIYQDTHQTGDTVTDSEQEHNGAGTRDTAVDTAVNAAAGDADIAMTVGEVSTLLGVSVRALHHWDESGTLPS